MYTFPSEFDANALVGRTLEMICFNANQIYFHFGRHDIVCAESEFRYGRPGAASELAAIPVPSPESDLMKVIEQEIVSASVSDGHILILRFDGGAVLEFRDVWGTYESYSVTLGGRQFRI
jgi:hypothetical protein